MKKIFIFVLIMLLLLTGCNFQEENSKVNSIQSSGIWISYSELSSMLKSEQGFKTAFQEAIENIKSLNITDVYVHVRPFCDSIYKSQYFPLNKNAEGYDYDILEFIITECHKNGILVHAWINPYRVHTASSDILDISPESPAYKWIFDGIAENDKNVCFSNGIYLNPAETQVQNLVISGIKEIIANYDVDGIHFDDYFYPTTDAAFDSASYQSYIHETEKPLSLEDYRRTNVNLLINGCYSAIKSYNKDIIFSISPAAEINKNYTDLYADVGYWIENGIIDTVIPQLYFGFEYPLKNFQFKNLLKEWKTLAKKNSDVSLLIGLAPYKIGTTTEPDNIEWNKRNDIISRQADICYKDDIINGYVLFSYSSVFDNNTQNKTEINNLKKIIEENYEWTAP